MQTTYDLVLQPMAPGEAMDVAPLQGVIRERGGVTRPDGALLWKLDAGEVVTWPLKEAGQITGLEVKVPFSDRTELLSQAIRAAVEVAKSLGLRVIDPQLQRTIQDVDVTAVTEEYLRMARYAGQYYGIGDALPSGLSTPGEEGMSPVMKGVLALLVMAVCAWAAYQAFSPAE